MNAVDNPHNGLTFCAGSLSAGAHNDTRELAKKFAGRTHFVHLRSTEYHAGWKLHRKFSSIRKRTSD
ncbi:mannonate dehydratase [Bacteroides ovatus]|nr:mannonate dehydratase [Bacteroides ovatus]